MAGILTLAPAAGAAATTGPVQPVGPCAGDACDNGAWLAARGVANDQSFWGMSAGHNCTNYVAWRLITDGVERPPTHPGNASEWAANAITDGFLVDNTPAIGAVAQWDAFAGGYGADGHVAYIEAVYEDGTVLVSEDYWRDGAQTGPLTYRLVAATGISNVIHYSQSTDRFRVAAKSGGVWTSAPSSLRATPSAMTAAMLPGSVPEVYFAQGGTLWTVAIRASAWLAENTGVSSEAVSLSALTMDDGSRPYVMSIDRGILVMTVRTSSGWQRMSTGFQVEGNLSAVNLGGLFPTVFVSQGGSLFRVSGGPEGWTLDETGEIASGPISAIVSPAGWPVVFNVRNGFLFRTWEDREGWHSESTGVPAVGVPAAVQTATGTEIYVVEDDLVWLITTDGVTWTRTATDLDGGTLLAVVDAGGESPLVAQVG